MSMNYLRAYATGNAAIAKTVAPGKQFQLVGFKLHLNAVGAAVENFTATVDADAGAAYDVVLFSQDMNAVEDIVNMFDIPIVFKSGDEIDFAYANSNAKTYGLEIIYQIV